jgi:hypothetical protein
MARAPARLKLIFRHNQTGTQRLQPYDATLCTRGTIVLYVAAKKFAHCFVLVRSASRQLRAACSSVAVIIFPRSRI